MMNIMIVEDEPPILREIKSTIVSFASNYNVVKCCYNGYDAIEYLKSTSDRIDVLITDIQLPVVNGLELIEYVTHNHNNISCIILSGYNDFKYAQKAIKLNVCDYLLKPISEDELRNVLKKTYEEKCIKNIFPKKFRHTINNTTKTSTDTYYYLAYLCLGSYPNQSYCFSEDIDKQWEQIDINYFKETATKYCSDYWLIMGPSSSEKILLLSIADDNFKNVASFINKLFLDITNDHINITVSIFNKPITIHDISSPVHALQKYIQRNICFSKSKLFIYDPLSIDTMSQTDMSMFYIKTDKLVTLFQSKNILFFENELRAYLNLMQTHSLTQNWVYNLLNTLFTKCFSYCFSKINTITTDSHTTVNDIIFLSSSYETLYDNLKSIFYDMFQMIIEKNDSQDKKAIIIQIDRYIKEHYKEPINTKLIADHFNFTPAYLSKIFRDYKNISPADYITTLRIDKAKELLSPPSELLVKDVSSYIGYEDSLYFSKVFKKYTGMSPKSFQQNANTKNY